jgi:hypothetical protein
MTPIPADLKETVEDNLRRICNFGTGSHEESSGSSESSQTSASASSTSTRQDLSLSLKFCADGQHDIPTDTISDTCSDVSRYDTINDVPPTIPVNKTRKKHQLSQWSVGSKLLLGVFIGIPGLVVLCIMYPGVCLLLEYRTMFGSKAPVTISPAHGVVSAHTSVLMPTKLDTISHEPEALYDDFDYQFKTYRPNPKLKASLSQNPIRLLVVGDSTARGIGHQKSCYSTMPETMGAVLSKHFGGRPVFWTAFGEPGATMTTLAKQVQRSATHVSGDVLDREDNGDEPPSMQEFHELHKTIANAGTSNSTADTDFASWESNDNHYSQEQEQWIEKLQYHERLYNANPFTGYDYIVALSGANDIKSFVVPFLVDDDDGDGDNDHTSATGSISNEWGFKGDLNRFVRDLNRISDFHNQVCTQKDSSECTSENNESNHVPYIILPSFPVKHVPLKSGAILRWMAIKCNGILDGFKKILENENPDQIFAAPSASDQAIRDFLDNKGYLADALIEEHVKLRLVHTNGKVCRDLVKELESFYSNNIATRESGTLFPELFSSDAVHPNDLGYDVFGRHLGSMVIKRWKD